MRIYLTNLGKYTEGELVGTWLESPCTIERLNTALKAIDIGKHYEEYFITDFENDLGLDISEYDNINELNKIAEYISKLDVCELQILKSVIESESPKVSDMMYVLERLEEYSLYPDIHNDEDLGYFYINKIGVYDLKSMGILANYLDYEAFGRDIRIESDGNFTSLGWLEKDK